MTAWPKNWVECSNALMEALIERDAERALADDLAADLIRIIGAFSGTETESLVRWREARR